jgi:multicomponent Na+:H+ antiporter subunit A
VFTVAYTVRLWWGLFGTKVALEGDGHHSGGDDGGGHRHGPSPAIVAPAALLAVLGLVGGLGAGILGDLLVAPATALDPDATKQLVLWAGLNMALLLSVGTWCVGWFVGRAVPWNVATASIGLSAERAYHAALDGLLAGARRLTRYTQSGSLLVYLSVILVVLGTVMMVPWALGAELGDEALVVADSPAQLAFVVLAIVFTVGVVALERRFVAALLVGGIGYCLAGMFILYGAPDLALTQVLVETLTIVVFLLVLRHLPEGFSAVPGHVPRIARVVIATVVGVGVAAFALLVGTSPTGPSAAEEFIPRSLPEAGGRNVVNVILVDFRGADTLGEITVLAIAAIGVANLVRAARRARVRATNASGKS